MAITTQAKSFIVSPLVQFMVKFVYFVFSDLATPRSVPRDTADRDSRSSHSPARPERSLASEAKYWILGVLKYAAV